MYRIIIKIKKMIKLRQDKIEYICIHIDNLTKNQKLEIAKLIWFNDNLRLKIKEKGLGLEINTKYMNDKFINKLYNTIKKFDYTDEYLK